MKVLVVGHESFYGRNMLSWLHQEEGWQVDGYEWHPVSRPDISNYDWVVNLGAITDFACTDVDAVLKQNFEFSQWLYTECCRHGTHLQYASSSRVYGKVKDFSEYATCNPQTPYDWSKYLFDRWVFQQPNNVMVQGFRYFDEYGKWDHLRGASSSIIYKWRTQARKEGKLTVWKNAEHVKRDFIWIGDICRLHIDFIKQVKGSGLWNVGSGLNHSLLDIAEEIAEQDEVEIEFVEDPVYEIAYIHTTRADLTNLKATIGKRKWLNVFEFLAQG